MPTAEFIVFERTSAWSLILRPRLAEVGVRLRETRSMSDCRRFLVESPQSMLAVELTTDNVASIIEETSRLIREAPYVHVAVLAQRGCESLEWILREVGAIEFVISTRRLGAIVELAKRHFRSLSADGCSTTEQIWAQLPWS